MSDAERLQRILASIPDPADADWLLEQVMLPAWCRRMMRLQRRDDAIRAIASERYGTLSSGRAISETMHRDLVRAKSGRAAHPDLERLLKLCGDRVPGETTLRNSLAGLSSGGQNSPDEIGHDIREPAALTSEV
jgi:hypothetical protein